jgi:hypothetical protein
MGRREGESAERNLSEDSALGNMIAMHLHCEGGPGKLELELIQTHMTQKPLQWVEVGAHAVRKRSEFAGVVWTGQKLYSVISYFQFLSGTKRLHRVFVYHTAWNC